MNILSTSKMKTLLALSALALSISGTSAFAQQAIVYPNAQSPLFTIEIPKNWTLTPAQGENEFFLVSGPAGVNMWFRAKAISSETELEAAVAAAKESGRKWFTDAFKDIQLEDGKFGERKGMPFISMSGSGVRKADDAPVTFAVAFASMPNGALAQFWSIIPTKNQSGEKFAKKVLESFEPK